MSLIARRINLMNSGSGIDWATIGKGMVDLTTPFSLPAEIVTEIPSYFCYYRGNLQSIGFNVSSVGVSAFQGCDGLMNVEMGDSVTELRNYAFSGCSSLVELTIPSSMTKIGSYAFRDCSSMQNLIINATTPPTLNNANALSGNNCSIYVPDSSVNAYKTASVWSSFASRIFSINDLNNS